MACESNYPIFIPCEDEDVRVGEISSRLSTLAIMDLLYLVILIVAIMMTSKGEDALPYILFFITAFEPFKM